MSIDTQVVVENQERQITSEEQITSEQLEHFQKRLNEVHALLNNPRQLLAYVKQNRPTNSAGIPMSLTESKIKIIMELQLERDRLEKILGIQRIVDRQKELPESDTGTSKGYNPLDMIPRRLKHLFSVLLLLASNIDTSLSKDEVDSNKNNAAFNAGRQVVDRSSEQAVYLPHEQILLGRLQMIRQLIGSGEVNSLSGFESLNHFGEISDAQIIAIATDQRLVDVDLSVTRPPYPTQGRDYFYIDNNQDAIQEYGQDTQDYNNWYYYWNSYKPVESVLISVIADHTSLNTSNEDDYAALHDLAAAILARFTIINQYNELATVSLDLADWNNPAKMWDLWISE